MAAEVPLLKRKEDAPARPEDNWIWKVHKGFDKRFERGREKYRESLHWIMDNRLLVVGAFGAFAVLSLVLVFLVGRDFFPTVDTGQIRTHIRPPVGTRIEESELLFGSIEQEIRHIIPEKDLQTILDNIGLPNSGINLAFSDTATISNSDGDILVDMKKRGSTALYIRRIREMIHQHYPGVTVFFLPADMTTQILNFGLPAAIDVKVSGRDVQKNYQIAKGIRDRVANIPGTADVLVFQEPNYPAIDVNVDRIKADLVGVTQQGVATNMLISLSATGQINPVQWVDPKNGVSYNVLVQTPQYRLDSLTALAQNSGEFRAFRDARPSASDHRAVAHPILSIPW